jgi:hypothetical protein
MPTDQISDADRNAAIQQSIDEMLGKNTRDIKGSIGNVGRLPYMQFYSQPATEAGGYPFTGLDQPMHYMGNIRSNEIPRTTIGATGLSMPDDSHGQLLSHFLPAINVPFDARAALVQALQSGPRPASGPALGRIAKGSR